MTEARDSMREKETKWKKIREMRDKTREKESYRVREIKNDEQ